MSLPNQTTSAQPGTPAGAPETYTVGTLTYTRNGLGILFFWLMWNDFSIQLLENVNQLTKFLMKDLGASYTEMATIGSFGVIGLWINPVFSVWSDRHRGKLGRRRPFLFATTPFLALFIMITPYMPDLARYVATIPWAASILSRLPISGPVLFIAIASIVMGLFNSMVLTVFSYLYWDVVPESVLGRFSSLSKIATAGSGFVWSFFFFGYGEHHMKVVYMAVSLFCLVVYLTSTWRIKEGQYPPPDEHKKGGFIAPVRAFIMECYTKPYFLWIFTGFTLFQLGNLANTYRDFYLHYDLKLNLDQIGKASAFPQLLIMALGFFFGSLADRLNAVRLMVPMSFVLALANALGYLMVRGQMSYFCWLILMNLATFGQGILYGALIPELYPREKLGQFLLRVHNNADDLLRHLQSVYRDVLRTHPHAVLFHLDGSVLPPWLHRIH